MVQEISFKYLVIEALIKGLVIGVFLVGAAIIVGLLA